MSSTDIIYLIKLCQYENEYKRKIQKLYIKQFVDLIGMNANSHAGDIMKFVNIKG